MRPPLDVSPSNATSTHHRQGHQGRPRQIGRRVNVGGLVPPPLTSTIASRRCLPTPPNSFATPARQGHHPPRHLRVGQSVRPPCDAWTAAPSEAPGGSPREPAPTPRPLQIDRTGHRQLGFTSTRTGGAPGSRAREVDTPTAVQTGSAHRTTNALPMGRAPVRRRRHVNQETT